MNAAIVIAGVARTAKQCGVMEGEKIYILPVEDGGRRVVKTSDGNNFTEVNHPSNWGKPSCFIQYFDDEVSCYIFVTEVNQIKADRFPLSKKDSKRFRKIVSFFQKIDQPRKSWLQRLFPFTVLLIIINAVCYGQKDSAFGFRILSVTVGKSYPCPMDTIKGWVYYNGGNGRPDFAAEGYFINRCGGLQSGPWADCEAPAFIFATAIRSDYIGSPHKFRKINYSGRFTDLNFKTIPKESVYGLLIPNKNEKNIIDTATHIIKGF